MWALSEPLDRRIFRNGYSDIAFLGKLVTRGRGWRAAGFAWHAANGAMFGLALASLSQRLGVPPRRLAMPFALAENVALYPLTPIVDARHPARGDPSVGPLWSRRAFAQATSRHAVFGWILSRLA